MLPNLAQLTLKQEDVDGAPAYEPYDKQWKEECIDVPFDILNDIAYRREGVRKLPSIIYYLEDVLCDERYESDFLRKSNPLNAVKLPPVQDWAKNEYEKKFDTSVELGTRFVMQIKDADSKKTMTGSYCLVPEEDTNLLERLKQARGHAKRFLTRHTGGITKIKYILEIRQTQHRYVSALDKAINRVSQKPKKPKWPKLSGLSW